MFGMFLKGGFAMYPLLLLSITMVAISIERLMYLWRVKTDVGKFMAQINEYFSRNSLQEALEYCEHTNSPISRIIKAGLKNQRRGRGDVIRAIEDEGALEVAKLEKGILTITTISKIAPMIGLFGTVTGMIRSFQAMGGAGGGNPALVATGISEALVATAAGPRRRHPGLLPRRLLHGAGEHLPARHAGELDPVPRRDVGSRGEDRRAHGAAGQHRGRVP